MSAAHDGEASMSLSCAVPWVVVGCVPGMTCLICETRVG